MDQLIIGKRVVVVWANCDGARIERVVDAVKQRTGVAPEVQQIELLTPEGGYDVVVSAQTEVAAAALARVLGALRPGGSLLLWEGEGEGARRSLVLHGFVDVVSLSPHMLANKPQFEVGARRPLRGAGGGGAAWAAGGAGDEELVDDEALLEETDRARPSAGQLRVCASTGERRACADCTCGLAAELRDEPLRQPTSSCGSCYLGDAFRCAACPYRGLPAFRAGDTVLLQDLAPDL